MRSLALLTILLLSSFADAAPRKKKAARPVVSSNQATVVVDAPPSMAKLIQSTMSARYNAVLSKEPLSNAPTAKEVKKVSAPSSAVAVVVGRAEGDSWTITVFSGTDGSPLDTQTFKTKKPLKALPKNVAGSLLLAAATGQAPDDEEGEDVGESPKAVAKAEPAKKSESSKTSERTATKQVAAREEADSGEETSISTPGEEPTEKSNLPAIRAGIGFRGFNRSLTWAGDPEQTLARYSLPFAPAVAIDAQWFPGAHFTSGIAANIGAFFQGDLGVGLSSRQDQSRFGTRANRFRFGGVFRIPTGPLLTLEAAGGYSSQTFAIDEQAANDGSPRPNIPSVALNGPRGLIGFRLGKLGPLSIDALGGFTYLASTGQLLEYFPRAGGFAIDAQAGVSLEVVPNIQVRAGLDWTRYFLTLRPEEGARFVAPSAADQYLGGSVSLNWVM
jgi:hypothetical protein